MVDKFKNKLAGWKRRMLSFAGRVELIKSVLSNLPVYYMSLFRMPQGIVKELNKIQSAFLWGGSDLKRMIHLVKWKDVSVSKKLGGLGIRNIKSVNECLLAKWWWRYGSEDNALWKILICSKYGAKGGRWSPFFMNNFTCSRIWSDILSVAQSNPRLFDFFKENVEIKVGNGRRIMFWEDAWNGSYCLKDKYPRLFSISIDKGVTLKEMVDRKDSFANWILRFRRNLRIWEEEELRILKDELGSGPSLCLVNLDSISWKEGNSGCFSVKAAYN